MDIRFNQISCSYFPFYGQVFISDNENIFGFEETLDHKNKLQQPGARFKGL